MPRSSRSKSHKQSKHSSKEAAAAREYSGSDEDVKMKERSSNGGKEDGVSFRISKDSSVSGERRKHGKDLFSSHGNGDASEEYTTSSKRREEKSHGGSDRWNGGSSDEKGVVVNIETKELVKSKDSSKLPGESKSKSSRRHDSDTSSIVVVEKDEGKSGSGNRGEKRKSEKESSRKESSQHKENKESKDKERGSDRGRKSHSDKPEVDSSSKHVENQSSKRGKESTDWPIEEGLRNPELEKELEKRMRRRGEASSDIKESDERRLSVKRHKDEGHSEKDEKHREDDRKNRDIKHRTETERHSKHRDDKHREDNKYKDDKYSEKYTETVEKEERKRKQDDEREYRHKNTDREKRSRDSSSSKYKDSHSSKDHVIEPESKRMKDDNVYDDRASRYKDDKDRKRNNNNNNNNDKDEVHEYRSSRRSESEKRSGIKADSASERLRPSSRYADVDHTRRRSSPSRDHHRVSKQEERPRFSSRSTEKVNAKDDVEKSPSVDEEPGQRSEAREQVDGDNLSVSSPYTRSSSFFGSTEDDRNKSNNNNNNNRHRRDSNMNSNNNNRVQGNWKNVPSWPSPMTPGGYLPFQHVPPPMFHPLMQQFPPPIFGRPPMKINPGLPYHVPDHGRPLTWRDESVSVSLPVPPPWDGSNSVFGVGDESHLYGWDRRNQMGNSRGEMWKGGQNVESQKLSDEIWSGQIGQGVESEQNQMDVVVQTSSTFNTNSLEVEKVTESVQTFEDVKEDNNTTTLVSQVYLSRVDVSKDLTQIDVYDECKIIMDLDHDSDNEFDCKILFFEEGVEEGNVSDVFTGVNDSVFQKAMFVYNKQKGEIGSMDVDVNKEGKMEVNDDDDVIVVVKQEEGWKVEEEGSDDVAVELIEFGSKVNLSRIQNHSPEKSTH